MGLTINGLLIELAREYYISAGSVEAKKIDASVTTLKTKPPLAQVWSPRWRKSVTCAFYLIALWAVGFAVDK